MFKFCDSPWSTMAIHANGDVSPCLCNYWHFKGVVGNLNQNSLEEIFSNKHMQDFKSSIIDQSFKFCNKGTCGKVWNLDSIESFDDIQTLTLPTTIYFQDLDYSCNLTCPSCRLKSMYSTEINLESEFVLNSVKQSYRNFNQQVMVFGDGQGEMLASKTYLNFLNAPDLPECFKFAINTNGNLLTKRMPLIEKLHSKGQVGPIVVSFDASNQKTYKKTRGGNLDLVIRGVRELVDRGVSVTAQMVVQYENYREILEYRDLCLSIGIPCIGLQKILRWGHMSDDWWNRNNIDDNPHVDYTWLASALAEFKCTPYSGICGGLETIIANKKVNALRI